MKQKIVNDNGARVPVMIQDLLRFAPLFNGKGLLLLLLIALASFPGCSSKYGFKPSSQISSFYDTLEAHLENTETSRPFDTLLSGAPTTRDSQIGRIYDFQKIMNSKESVEQLLKIKEVREAVSFVADNEKQAQATLEELRLHVLDKLIKLKSCTIARTIAQSEGNSSKYRELSKKLEDLSQAGRIAKSRYLILRLLKLLSDPLKKEPIQASYYYQDKSMRELIELLSDKNIFVQQKAGMTLAKLGEKAIPSLTEALDHQDWWVREAALRTLTSMESKPAAAVPLLIKALNDQNSTIKNHSALVLGSWGEKAIPAIPALTKTLQDKSSTTGSNAGRSLTEIGDKAIPAIIQALQDPYVRVRTSMAKGLQNTQRPYPLSLTPALLNALVKALSDKNVSVRYGATTVLGFFGEKAAAAVPALVKSLDDEALSIQRTAAEALGKIGKQAKSAIPALTKATQKYPNIKSWSNLAIERIEKAK